jgi:RNA polymerase sigma-70 factor (ECF subfamily)
MVGDEPKLKALFLAGLAGDEASHRAFLREIAGGLRAYFRGRLRHALDDVEDLVQETLIAVHTRRDSYDPSYPVTAWVYAIGRYRMIDMIRRKKRRGISIALEDAPEVGEAPEADAAIAKRDLNKLLETLPQKQREAIRLVKLEGVSVKEAADALAISESDVKISAHRGLKALTALIRGKEGP